MISIPFQTILVAIDESDVSNTALAAAIKLAKALSAKLMIVHVLNIHDVHNPQPSYPTAAADELTIDESIRQRYEREWTKYMEYHESLLKQKADEAIAAGVEADFIHPQGLVGSVLCEVARTSNVSLIVVGSHQRRGIAEIMLGSTSNYVMHHAPCSVLVVHPGAKAGELLSQTTPTAANRNASVV
ncbi:MAG: universal stress protein [Phormidesmis sp.]